MTRVVSRKGRAAVGATVLLPKRLERGRGAVAESQKAFANVKNVKNT